MPLHIQCTASSSETQGSDQRLPRANETVSKAPETEEDVLQRLKMVQDGAQSDIIEEVIKKTTQQLLASQPLSDSSSNVEENKADMEDLVDQTVQQVTTGDLAPDALSIGDDEFQADSFATDTQLQQQHTSFKERRGGAGRRLRDY